MIAAILHLHVSTGASLDALDQVTRGFLHGHDIVDRDLFMHADAEIGNTGKNASRFNPDVVAHFDIVSDDTIDFRHGGEAIRAGLRGAAGDDDSHPRALALEPPDGLARLTLGFAGDRTGIDDHHVAN